MHPKTFFDSAPVSPQNGKCFVLMPFAQEFTEVYDTIREAVEGPGLNFVCERADDIRGAGHIMESVLKGIGGSEIVIADLTGRNPNVFYEIGIAHMVKKVDKVILLIQDIETMPFDLNPFRCIVYKQSIAGAKKLKADLVMALKEIADLLTIVSDGASPIYQFRVESGERYQFPKQLFGESNCLYDFDMHGDYIGEDGAKFTLRITQYIAGRSPVKLPPEGIGMSRGRERKIPKIPWKLKLEKLAGKVATFHLTHE